MNTTNEGELAHLQVWELLPWIVNGRATQAERRLVDAHLRECERCRTELASQRRLCAAMTPRDEQEPDVERGLEGLWARLDEADRPAAVRRTPARWSTALAAGLAAIVLLETGALAMLGVRRGGDAQPAAYRTLSEPGAASGRATIRLVVATSMPVGQLQALLVPLHLQIVGGPSAHGVYSLAPVAGRGDAAKEIPALRAAPGVLFVEPVENAAP